MQECNNCKHKDCWEYAEPCSSCTNLTGEPTNWEPQTRADQIRAMSDKELAYFLNNVESDGRVYGPQGEAYWIDWLRQEVEADAKLD